jgi:predicted Zn-dependent protease
LATRPTSQAPAFATLDKWKSKDFRYGSDKVTLFADKVQPHSLGAVGYDDEGVKTQRWDLVKDGILVNYQAIRDQAHILGLEHSQGCCYADSWSSVQFQRMANVSLASGKDTLSPAEMVKNVENGIYIIGDGSFSIDQQRYNAQFGGQLFYEIKNGKITHMIEDVAYQIRTPEFWNACSAVCDNPTIDSADRSSTARASPASHPPCRTDPARPVSTASTSSTPHAASAEDRRQNDEHLHGTGRQGDPRQGHQAVQGG